MNKLLLFIMTASACLGIVAFIMILLPKQGAKIQRESFSQQSSQYSSTICHFIISCEKLKKNHQKYANSPDTFVVIGDLNLDDKYKIKKIGDIVYLYVRANDLYFGLPEKVIMTIEAFINVPEFAKYTHFYKIDDDCDIDFSKKTLQFQEFINKTPYAGVLINRKIGVKLNSQYHKKYAKQDPKNKWATDAYIGNGVNYLRGSNYTLNRQLVNDINTIWNSNNIDLLRNKEVFEDLMIGKVCFMLNYTPEIIPKNIRYIIDEFDNKEVSAAKIKDAHKKAVQLIDTESS